VQPPDRAELLPKRPNEAVREHRDAILRPFAVSDDNRAASKVDILDQHPFHDAQPRAIDQLTKQAVDTCEAVEQRQHFGLR
jgi:hypothetical protein